MTQQKEGRSEDPSDAGRVQATGAGHTCPQPTATLRIGSGRFNVRSVHGYSAKVGRSQA